MLGSERTESEDVEVLIKQLVEIAMLLTTHLRRFGVLTELA